MLNPFPSLLRPQSFILFFIFLGFSVVSKAQIISTVAGGPIGDGKPANTIAITEATAMTSDDQENLYFFDEGNKRIRKIDAITGIISTIAGADHKTGLGPSDDFISSTGRSMIYHSSGVLYFADRTSIKKITPSTGAVETIAGSDSAGYGGNNGLAKNAFFHSITSIAIDPLGNMYVHDYVVIRKINMTTGVVSAFAGYTSSGFYLEGGPALTSILSEGKMTIDKQGNIYITQNNSLIRKISIATNLITTFAGSSDTTFSGDGGAATLAKFNSLQDIAVDTLRNVYVTDNSRIRMISASTGIVNTIAGTGAFGGSGDGGPALSATFSPSKLLTVSKKGNLYFEDLNGSKAIRKIDLSTGIINRFCGNGSYGVSGIPGPIANAQLYNPSYLAADRSKNIYFTDKYNHKIYKIDALTNTTSVIAGTGVPAQNADNGLQATLARIQSPSGITVDTSSGNIYFVENGLYIRKIDGSTGIISKIAGNGSFQSSGDGASAGSAGMNPENVATDIGGNLYVVEAANNRVRKVSATTGIITTVAGDGNFAYSGDGGLATAAKLKNPIACTVDKHGNLYIVDMYNHVIRRVDAVTGIITTFAGNGTKGSSGDMGLATVAKLSMPQSVGLDTTGNVYVTSGTTLRKIDISTGIISNYAGIPNVSGYGGENVDADSSSLNSPAGIAIDNSSNVYISEKSRIRKVGSASTEPYKAFLSGSVFYDDNADGIKNNGESFADGITISSTKPGYEIRTVTKNGFFKLQLDTGLYITKPIHLEYSTALPASVSTSFTNLVKADSISIALQPTGSQNDLQVSLIGTTPVRPGFISRYTIQYKNEGIKAGENVKLVFVKSSKVTVNSSNPAFTSVSGDSVIWNLNTVPKASMGVINIETTIAQPPIVNTNDSLYFSAIISQNGADLKPSNDTAKLKQRVTGAFDPNDKTETHGGAISPEQLAAGEYLNYVIRFQNTGNDTAFTVVVRDTLDNKFDFSSLQMISASHAYTLSINDSNKLAWHFDNILLPDSNINEPLSHGFIAFRIKPKAIVVLGDAISNKSDIYFDFNPPVQTNVSITRVRTLPPPPSKPMVNFTDKQCGTTAEQKFKLLNGGYSARVLIGSQIQTVGADSTFSLLPNQMSPGNYTVRIEYINESGESSAVLPVTILKPVTPEITVSANKTTLTAEQEVVIVSGTNKKDGGTTPLFSFAKDRNFSNLLQAESSSGNASIPATQLSNGDNWIYIRMKTSETCYTAQTVIDSVRVTKNLMTTGIIDLDNPGATIIGYPNPFTEGITISGLSSIKKYTLQFFDAKGVLVRSYIVNNSTLKHFATPGLANGVYWINIVDTKKHKLIGTIVAIKQ